MENASKALIIAGAVLVTIMILTIGVYLVGRFGTAADSYTTTVDATELQKYNSNYEVFIGREDITAQELVTLVNLTQQSTQTTIVEIDGTNCTNDWNEKKKNEFLENNILTYKSDGSITGLYKYIDNSIQYDNYGKVKVIKFEKK